MSTQRVEVSHAAPVDAEYMGRLRDAIRAEKERLHAVFTTALISSGPPATQQPKTPEVMWQELQRMAMNGDPSLYQSDPNDPNSAMAWYRKLALQFGASPQPQQAQVFPGGAI